MARWEHLNCGSVHYGSRSHPPYDCGVCAGAPITERGWRYVDNLPVPPRDRDRIRPLGGAGKKRRPIAAARRRRLYERDDWTCAGCGHRFRRRPEELTLDHWIPVAVGGPSTDDNLRTMCRPCNAEKADAMPALVPGIVRGVSEQIRLEVDVPLEALLDGFMRVPCFECGRDPRGFEIADGHWQPCNRCKTSGVELVMC